MPLREISGKQWFSRCLAPVVIGARCQASARARRYIKPPRSDAIHQKSIGLKTTNIKKKLTTLSQ